MAWQRRTAAASAAHEETRLDNALHRADELLLQSLKSEEAARRKRRRIVVLACAGGVTMITVAVWIALAVANSGTFPAAGPAPTSLEGTTLAANAPAAPPSAVTVSRTPGAAATSAPAATKPADALPVYKVGDAVQVKWGGSWRDAKIVQRDNDIYLVNYNIRSSAANEWVTIDRVRLPGSARDIEYARPNSPNKKPDAAERAEGILNYKRSIGAAPPAPLAHSHMREEEPTTAENPGDLSDVRTPELTNAWEYVPDAPPPTPASTLRPNPVTLEASAGTIFEKVDAILFSTGAAPKAAVSVVDASPSKPFQAKMDLIDLAAGKRVRTYTLPPETKPLALSPDGSRAAIVTNKFGFGHNSQVDILPLGTELKPASIANFAPYAGADGPAHDVAWGFMPDNDHLLTMSGRSKLTLWKLPEAKAIWSLDCALASHAVVSPGGKYVLADVDQRTVAIEILSGKGAGNVTADAGIHGARVFHPAGKLLASAITGRIRIIDLAANKVTAEVFLQPGVRASEIAWAGDKFLLLDNRYLLDIDKGIVVWDYQAEAVAKTAFFGNYLWYVTTGSPVRKNITPTLAGITLPHPAALAAARAVDDKAYAIKPGIKVTLEVNTNGQGDQAKVIEALTQRLTENGMTVAPGQPVKLTASITPGKSHDIQYRKFGSMGTQTVNVTDQQVSLKFTVDDKLAWESGSLSTAPIFLQMKEGQSVEQAVQESQANAWKFFQTAELPKRMPAPREPLGFGKSPLTASR